MIELFKTVASHGLIWIWLLLFVMQVVAAYVGGKLGDRHTALGKERSETAAMITGGVITLTVFVLALTLSFSTSRLSERRLGALEEANAIGTAWLQARAMADPRAATIAQDLEDYARARLAYASADHSSPEIAALAAETDRLQSVIWADLTSLLADRNDPHSVSLMNALNHVFDMSTAERLALTSGVPDQLVAILVMLTTVSVAMTAFQIRMKGQHAPVQTLILIACYVAVLLVVLDLGTPRLGTFRTNLAPYEWTIASFADPSP